MDRLKTTGSPSADKMQSILPQVAETSGWRQLSGPLFRKYVALFLAVVCVALLTNGLSEILFSYRDHKTSLVRIQREQAEGAATKISEFIRGIESQVGWTTQLPWSTDSIVQRRFDGLRLLRQVPAITELSQLDSSGKERLRVSRLAMDSEPGTDYSKDPIFTEAVAKKVYYGPVYFRRELEPYMTLSLAGTRRDSGVSVAQVSLKLLWDVVAGIKVGKNGQSYLVDAEGRLISHPDISQVLRKTDMTQLAQVRAARSTGSEKEEVVQEAKDIHGRKVLTAYAHVPGLNWIVFVELPAGEAYEPLFASIQRSGLLLLAGLGLALLSGMFLAHRMVGPIRALRLGAARIGSGDLTQRITIKTGDELEELADQFNDMAGKLGESYADLEKKVEQRTQELAQSVAELRALGEVSHAVNSTLDTETVLNTIVTKAVQLTATDAGAIYVYDDQEKTFQLRSTYGMSERVVSSITDPQNDTSQTPIGEAARRLEPVQIADIRDQPPSRVQEVLLGEGYRALLVVPLIGQNRPVGALVVRRKQAGEFAKQTIDLLKTFAAQSVLAIQNARLFNEIGEKSQQLEVASQHKSQFLANMSHELRTPLNAILGYTELILDNIYGETPDRMRNVLDRVQSNGKHLLGLINDVLDLSKIEAGQLELSLADYSIKDVVHGVFSVVELLATGKKLALKVQVQPDMPSGYGDERRLTQVLLNLVGNAIKFTDQGEVAIDASAANGSFTVAVRDFGPGYRRIGSGQDFRGVPAGRQLNDKQEGRHGPRTGNLQAHRRNAWGAHLR